MVSLRCKLKVKSELDRLQIPYGIVDLGEVEIMENISDLKFRQLQEVLHEAGLELMDDKKAILIEKIKNIVVEMIHYADELPKTNFSDYLSDKLHMDYNTASTIFSRTKGITIEHYIMLHKIEKVKELLIYDELNLTEIAWKMHYSSTAHLSSQFKKVTGLTPTFFKNMKVRNRKGLEDI